MGNNHPHDCEHGVVTSPEGADSAAPAPWIVQRGEFRGEGRKGSVLWAGLRDPPQPGGRLGLPHRIRPWKGPLRPVREEEAMLGAGLSLGTRQPAGQTWAQCNHSG